MRYSITLFVLLISGLFFGQSDIFQSYVVVNSGSGNVFYDLKATTGNPDFQNFNLGTFEQAQSLILNGAENKTYKCGGDNILDGWLMYRVYRTTDIPPAFTSSEIFYTQNDNTFLYCTGTSVDQTWQTTGANIDITNGLISGDYYLEVYTMANGDSNNDNVTDFQLYANNGGANYSAAFRLDGVPVANCQNITVFLDTFGNASITPNDIDNGSSDDFDTPSLSIDIDSFDCSNLGTNTVTLTVEDSLGQTDSCTATVTVVDAIAPIITLTGANPLTIEACDAYVELGATANDTCSGDISGSIVIDASTVNTSVVGSYIVTYNVTDTYGNNAIEVTRTVNVVDTTPPVIVLNGNATVTVEACGIYTEPGAMATDGCQSIGAVIVGGDAVDTDTVGTYIVTYNITDASGNPAAQVTRTVNVVDTTVPVIVLNGNATVTVEACGIYTEPGAMATDGCQSIGAVIVGGDTVDTDTVGTYIVTYNITDASGNPAAQVTRTVNVVDTTPPVIVLNGNATVTVEACSIYTEPGAMATDGCQSIGAVIVGGDTVDTDTVGTYIVTYNITDAAGNAAAQVTRTVNVVDTTVPVIVLSGNATVTVEACGIYTEPGAIAADCEVGLSVIINNSAVDTSTPGSYLVTYNITDTAGNAATQVTRTVIVEDTTPPAIPTLPVISGQCSATVTPPTTTDSCTGTITGITTDALTYSTQGTYIITWVFDDGNGNSVSANQTVNINDTVNPTTVCRDITVQLDNTTGLATITPDQIDNGSTDNCSSDNLIFSLSQSTFDCTDIGPNVIVFTIQDAGGNTASCTATVTVISPGIEGGTISGYITNTQTPADASDQYIEITACPDEPQNAILTLNTFSGTIIRWETSTNGGLNWTSVANTADTFNYNNIQETTLVRAIVEIGLCQASSSIFYVVVVPPDVAPTIIGPTEYDVCLGSTITVEAESSYGVIPDFNEGGMFNQANPNGWSVDEQDNNLPAAGNNETQTEWGETNGPRNFGGRCYNNFDGKFAIASGIGDGPFSPITTLETPVFNTLGLTSASLEFEQAYYLNTGAYCLIELSLDGGNTYPITLDPGAAYDYTGPSDTGFMNPSGFGGGGPNGCANVPGTFVDKPVSINLQDYIGLVGLRIKFTFYGNAGSTWAIDNVRIPDAPVDEVIEWTDENGVVVTSGSTTTITPITPGIQFYGVTSLINGCRADGDEGTSFIEVKSSLSYAGENVVAVAGECGPKDIQLAAYNNQLTAIQNYNNGVWNNNYVVPNLVNGDTDYPGTGENGFWQVSNVVSTCAPNYSFSNLNSPDAIFTADPGIYTLLWTVAGCSSSIEVTIDNCDEVDFDGTNDYVSFGNNYNLSGNFSIELWVKPESVSGQQTLLSKRNPNDLSTGYDLSLNGNILTFNWNNVGSISSSISISTNRWYHIAVVNNSGTYILYIDGIQIASQNGSAPTSNALNCLLGAMGQDTTINHFNGWVDEFRVWNMAITVNQLRMMMNQEVANNGNAVRGVVVPLDVAGINWTNLLGYYKMDSGCGALIPSAGTIMGSLNNMFSSQQETAPIPYTSRIDAQNWTDNTTWTHFNVWDIPNGLGIDGTPIDWNIVRLSHTVNSGDKDITVLGLLSEVPNKVLNIADPISVQNETNDGQSLRVTHYLKLDGIIDLVGESQLLQDEGSVLDVTSAGHLERDQQGTTNLYNYNYWGSPVGAINTLQNNLDYSIGAVLYDGTTTNPLTINWTSNYDAAGTTNPITLSNRWLYAYENHPINSYASWRYLGSTSTLMTGLGFTMKGSGVGDPIDDVQNYVFIGKPNNGEIEVDITNGNQALVGNPYPSAIDAHEFIRDNLPGGNPGTTQSITGNLYFWEHYQSNNTHILSEYEGGYGVLNLTGGLPTVIPDFISGAGTSTKTPGQYIPVGQGFFVEASGMGTQVAFNNSQRIYQKEDGSNSVFFRNSDSTQQEISENQIQRIRFLFKSSVDGVNRPLLLGFMPNNEATDGFDYGYDALANDNLNSDLAFLIDNDTYLIQGVGSFDPSKMYPLSLSLNQSSLIEIEITDFENFDTHPDVYIYDAMLGTSILINDNSFVMALDTGEYTNRFFVTFQKNSTLDITDYEDSELTINYLSNNKVIFVRIPNKDIKRVRLYSLIGQSVKEWENIDQFYSSQNSYKIPVETISEGTYIIQVETAESTHSRKVIVSY